MVVFSWGKNKKLLYKKLCKLTFSASVNHGVYDQIGRADV